MHLAHAHASGALTSRHHECQFSTWKKNTRHDKLDLITAARKVKGNSESSPLIMKEQLAIEDPPVQKRAKRKTSKATNEDAAPPSQPIVSAAASPLTPAAAPFSFDASSLFQNLPPNDLWLKPRLWVCFTDLHLSSKTFDQCIGVLRKVHLEALRRSAGIVFLGDFWDERGSLPVEPLNGVLEEVSKWSQPCLFLVGNHDQVDLGGKSHSLTPLQCSQPLIHVFDSPTVFRGALWLPYRRDKRIIEAAIGAASSSDLQLRAVMAHADVQTARFNYAIQSREGLPAVGLFPPDIPVYTGHYHLPHTVPYTKICYIGSAYQVTAAEAGEEKRMVVFDAENGWDMIEEIPLLVGPRYVRLASIQELESPGLELQPGDRVKLTLTDSPSDSLDGENLLKRLELTRTALESKGIKVDVSRLKSGSDLPRIIQAEDKQPDELLSLYGERSRMSEPAMKIAMEALGHELSEGGRAGGGAAARNVNVEMRMVEIEGWGPFKDLTKYDLSSRGLRAIVGQNEDDGGSDSNGSGKTCLVTAPYWCLTDQMLSRSESGSSPLAKDAMLHDGCKKGRVKLEGIVNGLPFILERVVERNKTSRASFTLDGKQMDKQDKKGTQELIDEQFNTDLLHLSVFYGQNDITQLLVAEDVALKAILKQVVEMDVWEGGRDHVKEDLRRARTEIDQAVGQMMLLEKQKPGYEAGLLKVKDESAGWEASRASRLYQCLKELEGVKEESSQATLSIRRMVRIMDQGLESLCLWTEEVEVRSREEEQVLKKLKAQLEAHSSSPPSIPIPYIAESSVSDLGEDSEGEGGQALIDWDHMSAQVHKRFTPSIVEAEVKLAFAEKTLNEAMNEAAGLKAKLDLIHSQIKQASLPPFPHHHEASVIVCDKCLMEVNEEQKMQRLDHMRSDASELEVKSLEMMQAIKVLEAKKKWASDALGRVKKEEQVEIQATIDRERQAADEKKEAKRQALDALKREQEAAKNIALQAWKGSQSEASRDWEIARSRLIVDVDDQTKKVQGMKEKRSMFEAAINDLSSAVSSARPFLATDLFNKRDHELGEAGESQEELASRWLQVSTETLKIIAAANGLRQRLNVISVRHQSIINEVNPHDRELMRLERQLAAVVNELSELIKTQSQLEAHQIALEEAEKALGRSGVQSFILEATLKEWEERSRGYLEQLTDGMSLELSATKASTKGNEDAKEIITKTIRIKQSDGSSFQRSIHQLSGGERRRLAVALTLGFSDLVRSRGRLKANILILDEVLQQLDAEGCSKVALMLKSQPHETILVVGQARSFVETTFEMCDRVIKKGGSSVISEQS